MTLLKASYLLGAVATWCAMVPRPWRHRDLIMVAVAVYCGILWPYTACGLLRGKWRRDYAKAYGEEV